MRHPEEQYLDIIRHLLEKGDRRVDRTGVGTLSMFGAMMRFDLSDGTLPVFTTKKVFWKTAVKEMLWFLTGRTDLRSLLQENIRIWTDWPLARYRKESGENISQADFEDRILSDADFSVSWGDLGPIYGKQWRRWVDAKGREHDQVATVIETLKTNPSSRRMLFHAWNVPELDRMALHPCHMTYQFHVAGLGEEGVKPRLSLMVYQRSCDILLGAPFNICQQAALLAMVAAQVDMQPGELIWAGGDVHLYLNHLEQAREQISRTPFPFARLALTARPDSIDGYRIEDFSVTGYQSHDRIDAPVAV
jgi:thymidylate synthase